MWLRPRARRGPAGGAPEPAPASVPPPASLEPAKERGGVVGGGVVGGGVGEALHVLATLGPPLTIATALLFYFGWARSNAEAKEFGIDLSVLGMSTQDYVLNSIRSLYLPVALAAAFGLAWLWLDQRLRARLAARRGLRTLAIVARALTLGWVAVPLAAYGLVRLWPLGAVLIVPLSLTVGILATAYGVTLLRRLAAVRAAQPADPGRPWRPALERLLVGVLVVLTLFWEVANLAEVTGRGYAAAIANDIAGRPGVVIYSVRNLALDAPGVTTRRIRDPASAYAFRYDGLRLLQHSGGQYFLLSDGWTPDKGIVTVIPDGAPVRIEFTRG